MRTNSCALRRPPISAAGGTVSYVYDADGNQVLRRDGGVKTLYLPGQEITYTTATGATKVTKYYSHNGTVVAMRTNAGNPIYLMADHHGSHQVAVSPTSWAVTRRYLDPYGNQLGTGTGTWPTTHGFLDKPQSSITGLSDLGARKYDPKIGRFLSVDPLLFPDNPALLNGYNYVGNNPVGYSDPSGLGPNPDSPVKPPCVPTIQNCGPRGDGVSNGYEHKPSQVPAQTQELIDEEIKNRIDEGQDPETARTQAYQNAIEQNTFAYELKDQILADYCTWADDAICHPASGFEVAVAATAFVPVTWGPRAGLALTGLGARIFGGGATKIAAKGAMDIRPPLSIGSKQFGTKWGKHAADYDLDPASSSSRSWFMNRARGVHLNPDEVRRGAWNPAGGGGDNYFFFRQGDDLLITQPGGEFVTMFPGGSNNAWFKSAEVFPH